MIKLGDVRILEKRNPDLMSALLHIARSDNPVFQSQEFQLAMKDTRRGVFTTLIELISRVNEEDGRKSLKKIQSLVMITEELNRRTTMFTDF